MGQRDRQVVAVISLNVVSNVFSFLDTLKKGGGKETVCETTSASTGAMQLEFSDCKSSSSFLFLWGNAATANTAVDPVMLSLDLVRAADMVVFCVGVADESVSGHSDAKKSDPIDAVYTYFSVIALCSDLRNVSVVVVSVVVVVIVE